MEMRRRIGIFDSGIGGVTVLKEIIKLLPNESYYYYSDSKNNPYGDKTEKDINKICEENVKYLLNKGCTVIVIACNTASAVSAEVLRMKYPSVPIIAIEPAYKMVYDYAYDKDTLVMATKGTIDSERFHLLFDKYDNHKTVLLSCSGLADAIENGNIYEIRKCLEDELIEYKGKIKNVVLGCTHYPLIQDEISKILGNVKFFNGAKGLAIHLKEILDGEKLSLNKCNNIAQYHIEFEDSLNHHDKKERFFDLLQKSLLRDVNETYS